MEITFDLAKSSYIATSATSIHPVVRFVPLEFFSNCFYILATSTKTHTRLIICTRRTLSKGQVSFPKCFFEQRGAICGEKNRWRLHHPAIPAAPFQTMESDGDRDFSPERKNPSSVHLAAREVHRHESPAD